MVLETQSQVQQPLSAEEEALKRNTDCVYFLASPLTCKKGSECEYRHSEIARVNPRDCWYWVNSNCLNPKCAFRHPPLEGFLGAQATTSNGSSIPQTQTTTAPYVANVPGKQGVPCVFFQKGYCLKGDWCPFLHVPSSSSNKTLQVGAQVSASEPVTIKKATVGIEKYIQEKKTQTLPVANSGKAKENAEVEIAILKNEFGSNIRVQQASVVSDVTGYRNIPPISNGTQVNWSNRVKHSHQVDEPESMNSKDEEEVSREPSPGFDVLVDDEGRDSDYYLGEDRHGMSTKHEMNGYDIGHSNDYADLDDEIYQEPIGYDSHERYAWDQQRVSSERISDGSYVQRRPHTRNDSRVQVNESDLRHRLSRHKKQNGLRSVISRVTRDMDAQDQSHQGSYESRNARDNNALSSRLQGRIRLPSKSSSPTNGNINRLPVRTSMAPHQGNIRDRIKGRVEDSYENGLRARSRGSDYRKDDVRDDNNVDFSGPKSLTELKNKKIVEPREHHVNNKNHLGKRKHSMVDENQQAQGGMNRSFEGPKSLEEILKRKRGESSGTTDEHRVERKPHKEENDLNDKEFNNFTPSHTNEDETSKSNALNTTSKSTTTLMEEGEHVNHGADLETEALEKKDADYDYEQTGGEDYEYYDGENGDAVDEYVEDEDEDDDFAKKMGVVYS